MYETIKCCFPQKGAGQKREQIQSMKRIFVCYTNPSIFEWKEANSNRKHFRLRLNEKSAMFSFNSGLPQHVSDSDLAKHTSRRCLTDLHSPAYKL